MPKFRSSALQFIKYGLVQFPPRQSWVRFSVGAPEPGVNPKIYPIVATNVSGKTLYDVTFVSGEFETTGRRIEPGKSIKLIVDHVTAAPAKLLEDFSSSSENNHLPSSDLKGIALFVETHGQTAVLGKVDDLPIGPNLTGPHQYLSTTHVAVFAPLDLKLP